MGSSEIGGEAAKSILLMLIADYPQLAGVPGEFELDEMVMSLVNYIEPYRESTDVKCAIRGEYPWCGRQDA
jgi:hypothetical protein